MGTVSPVGLPSGAGSSSIGLSAGFRLLGHFRGFILGAGLLLWIVGQFVGLRAVLWAFSWAVSRNPRVAFARGG